MINIGTVVRVVQKGSEFEGWLGVVTSLYGQEGMNGVYVKFTSEFGYTERLMFTGNLEEVTDPEPLDVPREDGHGDTCHCGNYVLSITLGENVVLTVEAVTGMPNGPMEAHTRAGCYCEVQVPADLEGVTRLWIDNQSRMFPLSAKHPLFAMGTHSCCSQCGEMVDLSEEFAHTDGKVMCAEHANESLR